MSGRPAKRSAADIFNERYGTKTEIPWCGDCRDWHFPGPHTRMRAEQRDAYARGERVFVGDERGRTEAQDRADAAEGFGRVSGFNFANQKLEAALRVLGIGPDASVEDARAAFRAAIKAAHPDHEGGSEEQAKRVLAAKDELERVGRL